MCESGFFLRLVEGLTISPNSPGQILFGVCIGGNWICSACPCVQYKTPSMDSSIKFRSNFQEACSPGCFLLLYYLYAFFCLFFTRQKNWKVSISQETACDSALSKKLFWIKKGQKIFSVMLNTLSIARILYRSAYPSQWSSTVSWTLDSLSRIQRNYMTHLGWEINEFDSKK